MAGPQGQKKKGKKTKKVAKAVVFDEKAREEFLTGFRKRNLEKKKKAKERYEAAVKKEKSEKRKEKRQKLREVLDTMIDKIEAEKQLTEATKMETETVEFVDDNATTTPIAFLGGPVTPAWGTHRMRSPFKDQYPFEQRKAKAEALRQQHSDRVPIICEKLPSTDLPDMTMKRFIVPSNFTVANFITVVRTRIKVGPERTLFIFVNNTLLPANSLLSTIYHQHRDQDGFLYLIYSSENAFGHE